MDYVSLPNWNKISWRKHSRTLANNDIDDNRSHDGSFNGCAFDLVPRFVVPFFLFAAGHPVPVIMLVPIAFSIRIALMPVHFVTVRIDVPFVTTFAAWIVLRIRLPVRA